jgi:transposase
METLVERCAGLDVHKDSVTACVRVPDGHGGRQTETRRFTTTTAGLMLLAQWLASFGVTRVGWNRPGATGSRSGSCWRTRSSAGC